MHTHADELLDQLSVAYGEFWETWLVPTAIGAGVWCARLHSDHKHYINAESPAMLETLMDRDDQLARRVYSSAATGTRQGITPAATPPSTSAPRDATAAAGDATTAAGDATTAASEAGAKGDVA